ncbi:MAG: cytochrome c4 [Nitrosomonadales bacterium]|nr:cytochrome c4 [Nitrosomonadales bacterium]
MSKFSRATVRLMLSVLIAMWFSASFAYADENHYEENPEEIAQRIGSGDPVAGKTKSLICQACHGADGSPSSPDCPKLAGQYAVYIQKEIRDFQNGSRKDPTMTDIAARLTNEQDLLDISAYFASQKKMQAASPVINEAGKRRFLSGNGCETCHGVNGKGQAPNNPIAPVIGGQFKSYLVKQLKDFRSNTRTNEANGIMGLIADLMNDEQIEDVASYESGL